MLRIKPFFKRRKRLGVFRRLGELLHKVLICKLQNSSLLGKHLAHRVLAVL